ncbi:MAG: hypothetical protein LLH30_18925 [Candidatus Manganitrophus sp. SA1]|nr:hypothetical protein [Candidatus Manganitrophus morganii]
MKRLVSAMVMVLAIVFAVRWGGAMAEGAGPVPKETLEAIGPQLAERFTFEPFQPAMPDHLWMKADPDKVVFLHFAKPVGEKENKLIFIGEGVKGRFCAEDQLAGGKTGFVHFHASSVAKGHDHGHGGDKSQEGYWLRHIAVDEFDMMKMHFTPGVAHNFMPTPPPKCK